MKTTLAMKFCSRSSLAIILFAVIPACSTTTTRQPNSGQSLIDASPGGGKHDRIRGIRVVSVNGKSWRGSEASLVPGRNVVRIGFNWPQGGRQEVDLLFRARDGLVYLVQYDVNPPYTNQLRQGAMVNEHGKNLKNLLAGADRGALMFTPLFLGVGVVNLADRVSRQVKETSRPANYIDIMVISKDNSEGVVRIVRVYPNGRAITKL